MAKKMTIAERKAALQQQLVELDALEDVQLQLNYWISECDTHIKDILTDVVKVGESDVQAAKYDGQLLYTLPDDWRRYTQAQLVEMDMLEDASPAHDPIYENRPKEESALWDYEKQELAKWRKLKTLLQSLEV